MADYDLTSLERLTNTFCNQYKKVLVDDGKVATGTLVNSIHGAVRLNGVYLEVSIFADETWKYVEFGRKPGRRPPMDAILSWIQVKGLPRSGSLQRTYQGKLPTEKQLAFLIARKIGNEGIPAGNYLGNLIESTHFYDNVKKTMAKMISDNFEKQLHEEISTITEVNI